MFRMWFKRLTSSLDPYTKELLNMNIGHILKDKLIIIVSHDVKYIPEDAHVYEVKDKKIYCLK